MMKALKNSEMIGLSAALLDEKRHRAVFLSIPLLAALLAEVEAAHAGLLVAAPPPDAAAEAAARELAELNAEGRAADRTHDRKSLGLHGALDAAVRLADDPDDAVRLAGVRDALFPDGTAMVNATWAAEAGNAERMEARLADADVRGALAEITVRPGVTLLDEARACVAAGRALGRIESRKAALHAASAAHGAPRAGSAAARNEWIQTMNLVLATAKRLKGEQAERFAPVLREIQRVEAKSDARAARTDTADDEGVTPVDGQPANDGKAPEPLAPTG